MQAHYTAPSTPESSPADGQWKRFRDPRVMRHAEETGPWMPAIHRAVYKFVSEFANPATGEAFPSQKIIGRVFGLSHPTVRKICDQIETIGGWEIEKRRNDKGHKYNVYHLVGLATGWAVVVPQAEKHETFLTPTERNVVQMRRGLERAMELLVAAGITAADIIDVIDIEHLPNPCKIGDFTWVEEGDGEDEIPPDEIPDPPLESHVERVEGTLEDLIRAQEASADPVAEFVEQHLEQMVKPKGPFEHRGGALKSLRASPAEFKRWRDKLAPKEVVSDIEAREYRSWNPGYVDPEAEKLWQTVLEDLLDQKALPRWRIEGLRRHTGVAADDNFLVVMVANRVEAHGVDRIYWSLVGALRRAVGDPLRQIQIVVSQDDETLN